jgi:hypothetical protein
MTIAVLTLIAIIALTANYGINNQSKNRLAYIYGMDILNCVPQNSVLISIADNSNSSIYYLHYVEGIRKDLEIYDPVKTYNMLKDRLGLRGADREKSGQELCLMMLYANQERAYVVKEHMLIKGMPIAYNQLKLTPNGMVYRAGSRPMARSLWSRLEIPQFDDPGKQLDFKGLTMLCNLYLCRGEDLQATGDDSRAMSDYNIAADLAASSSEASIHGSLGIFYRKMRKTGLAEQEYNRALNSRHLTGFERANILVNLGNVRKDKGNLAEAIDLYNQALKINNNNDDARYNLALAIAYRSLSENNFKAAVENFEAARLHPGADPKLIFNIAVLYDVNLNDTAKAIFNYQRFAEIAPALPESQTALRRIKELRHE